MADKLLGQGHAQETLVADIDLVRSLVRSWGDLDDGSVAQARAVLNSQQVLQHLLQSAHNVITLTKEV